MKENGFKEKKRKIVLQRRLCPIRKNTFPDATKMERELLTHGTVKDKINAVSLLVERNPSAENYKCLLAFCESQRNDVQFYALSNIRDILLSKRGVEDAYIKQRIVKTFDINLRNQYIKSKVVGLVFKLLEERILFVDLIHLFVDKLGDKKEMSGYVASKLHVLMPGNEEVILDGLEDFYFKNDLFRARHVALQFLARLDCVDKRKAFGVFDAILEHFNEGIPEEHRNILLEDVVVGLGKNITDEKISRIDVVRRATHTEKMVFYGSKVLFGTGDPEMLGFLRNAIKSHKMRDSKHLAEFMNIVSASAQKHGDRMFYGFLLDSCFLYNPQYIACVLVICAEAGVVGLDNAHSLRVLALHHSDIVRRLALQMIRGETVLAFDPFDRMSFTSVEMMCEEIR